MFVGCALSFGNSQDKSTQRVTLRGALFFVCLSAGTFPVDAWHNGGDQQEQPPKFGTHDYIALKALDRAPAPKVAFIRERLLTYFIGTEAPDANKKIPGVTEGGYKDSLECHCILFDFEWHVAKAHARNFSTTPKTRLNSVDCSKRCYRTARSTAELFVPATLRRSTC